MIGSADLWYNYLQGGVRNFRTVIFSVGDEKLTLPVTPSKYSITAPQNNKIVDILDFGEALIFGTTALKKLKISGFFPATFHQYTFVVGDIKEPAECVDTLTKWKEGKSPVRVIVTDSPVNLLMGIEKFVWREKDGSRDIYFDLDFAEYRDLNVPAANYQKQIDTQTGLKNRPGDISEKLMNKLVSKALDVAEINFLDIKF